MTLAPNEVVGIRRAVRRQLRRLPRRRRSRGRRDRARQSRVPRASSTSASMRASHRRRRARHVDAGLRATRRRDAHREADRCDRQRDPIALEPIPERSTARIRLRMPRRPRATFTAAKPRTRRSASRATARTVEAVRREAPSRTIRFWRWSSDQGLRTIVIAGRPELGAPDWRGNVAGTADVGSGSHRRRELARLAPRAQRPGQPYSAATERSALGA